MKSSWTWDTNPIPGSRTSVWAVSCPCGPAVWWDMTHSQSDWTHPLKTQQLSVPFGKYDVTSLSLCTAHFPHWAEGSFPAALCCKTCLIPKLGQIWNNNGMTSATAGVSGYWAVTGNSAIVRIDELVCTGIQGRAGFFWVQQHIRNMHKNPWIVHRIKVSIAMWRVTIRKLWPQAGSIYGQWWVMHR